MSSVYERSVHASYERRAKNDLVVKYIAEKFLSSPSRHTSKQNPEDIIKLRDKQEAALQEERLNRRKQKEREVKDALDMQVKLQRQE